MTATYIAVLRHLSRFVLLQCDNVLADENAKALAYAISSTSTSEMRLAACVALPGVMRSWSDISELLGGLRPREIKSA